MPHTCAVYGCHNRGGQGEVKRSFHSVPTVITIQGEVTEKLSLKRRELWIARINRKDWTPSIHIKICSDHFVTGRPCALYDTTHQDWAPSLKLGSEKSKETDAMERYARANARKNKKETQTGTENLTTAAVKETICTFLLKGKCEPVSDIESVTLENEEPESENEMLSKMRIEFQRLTSENGELKQKLADTKLTPESLEGNYEKVKYLTGLPGYLTLMFVFNFLESCLSETSRSSLTKFQKLMLVLMKLRLNLAVQDLAYRFSVSKATVSRTFNSVVHAMYERMKGFILWPDREQLQLTMPMEFRKSFGLRTAIIIDCFEMFIERPSNLLARAQTWSSYKHHNTVKYLIGITPQGTVSFLSKAFGGRSSDKHITENCGLLQKLLPGDLVLADRGFDIAESVGLVCAEVKIPAFTKGKKQLSPLEVEYTRKIAHVRIHIERVIGLVRNKYTILQDTLPIDYLQSEKDEIPVVDKIVTVCCSLTNLCESVVNFD